MIEPSTIIVTAILGLFFLASVLHQLRLNGWWIVSRYDLFHLLPRYSFFAPNPGRHDTYVVYRDRIAGQDTRWHQLQPGYVDRRWRWIWNPNRYQRKAISDLANGVLEVARRNPNESRIVLLSSSYMSLLVWVMAQPPLGEHPTHRQFALIGSHGFGDGRELDIRFVSEVHRSAS